MSLYGYRRETTPNIARFAERANVYHAHHSGGTFTTAGTASLLTGMYPWTHRAINVMGLVAREQISKNIFNLLSPYYFTSGFSQNIVAEILLAQFDEKINKHLSLGSFSRLNMRFTDPDSRDALIKYRALDGFLFDKAEIKNYRSR